jgi:hypothetical protein
VAEYDAASLKLLEGEEEMRYKIRNGCKFREESFGGILRVPVDIVLKTGQTFYKIGFLELFILQVLESAQSVTEIAMVVIKKYDVDFECAKKDITDFLNDLVIIGVVEEVKHA